MSISRLLSSLEEYLLAKKEYINGLQTEDNLMFAKKNFSECLNEYVDYRLDGVLEERKRRIPTETSIKVAEVLSANLEVFSAPEPLPLPERHDNQSLTSWLEMMKTYEDWMAKYREWFEKTLR